MDLFLAFSVLIFLISSFVVETLVFTRRCDISIRFARGVGFFFSGIIAIVYFFWMTNQPFNPVCLYGITAAICIIFVAKGNQRKKIDVSGWSIAAVALIFVLAGGFFILPSIPTFYPIAYGVDAAHHYGYAKLYYQNLLGQKAVLFPFSGWVYPYGIHVISALLAVTTGIELLSFIYPFVVFIIALSAITVYGLVS